MLTQNLLAEERTESNARIGLSSESRWPRHQTNLEAFIAASTDPDTVAAVGDELGIVDLEATGSYVEGVFVVDLDVSGEIGADVTTASEMLIEQAIEQVTTDIDGNDIIELEVLQATLITVNEDLAATAAPLDRLEDIVEDGAAELETDWTFAAQTAWDEDRDELADLVATRNTLENRQRDSPPTSKTSNVRCLGHVLDCSWLLNRRSSQPTSTCLTMTRSPRHSSA